MISQNHADLRKKLGRPPLAKPKQATTIRFDADILAFFKAKGKAGKLKLIKYCVNILKTIQCKMD